MGLYDGVVGSECFEFVGGSFEFGVGYFGNFFGDGFGEVFEGVDVGVDGGVVLGEEVEVGEGRFDVFDVEVELGNIVVEFLSEG